MHEIKILYVLTTLGLGGVQEHLRLLIKNLDKSKFDIWVAYGPPADKVPALKGAGATLVEVGLVKRIQPLKDLKAFVSLWLLMRRQSFDIVHVHMTKAGILGRLAAKLAGVKVVLMTGHGWSGHLDNYFSSFLAKKLFYMIERLWGKFFTDGVILLTKEDYEEIRRRNMYPESKLYLVPNGIDRQELEKAASDKNIRDELAFKMQDKLIVMVGRICKVKAPWVYVEAAKKVLPKRADVRFLLIGEGPQVKEVIKKVSEIPQRKQFHLLGQRQDVPSLLKGSNIFVLTSITEGMSMTLLEAMALGLAVVVTDIPGNRALVEDGETGIFIPPNNPEALAQVLLKLLDDESLRKRLGQNAKEHVEKYFASSNMGRETIQIYNKFLGRSRPSMKSSVDKV